VSSGGMAGWEVPGYAQRVGVARGVGCERVAKAR
jgi:hypothetical protein